jgi:hypothetical protein
LSSIISENSQKRREDKHIKRYDNPPLLVCSNRAGKKSGGKTSVNRTAPVTLVCSLCPKYTTAEIVVKQNFSGMTQKRKG